ncbi:hypothetical protein ACRXCV_15350 [Halobacteriovorax sp. GFR7]|uniref:hypothetical protein n=1 Tax=unclassified Halobacteriovorax TaxID=2639665 RepID=UPI003D975EF2
MSLQIDVYTFLTDDIFNKLREILSLDINLINTTAADDLSNKSNIITNDLSFNASADSRILYVGDDVTIERASVNPDAILLGKENVVLEIEQFFGVKHTPKQRKLSTFTSVKQYKISSRFSIGYYTDLINLKLDEKSFEVENYASILQPLLSELILVKQASPVEIDLFLSNEEALIYINAFSIYIDDALIEKISTYVLDSCSFFSLKRNDRRGQLQICFTIEKMTSYFARFVFTNSTQISREDIPNADVTDNVIDHNNYHDPIVKKVTVKALKELVAFMKERNCNEEDFLDNLDAYPDKAILKILKDDEIAFIKKSLFTEVNVDLEKAITTTVKDSFCNPKEFNDKFFNNIDRKTFKELVKPDSWPLDGDKLKNEIADEVLDKTVVKSYDEYIENVKEYVSDNYSVVEEDFVTIKDSAEGNIAEEIIRAKGQNVEEFLKSSEMAQMKAKVARMSLLFNKMKDELERTRENGSTAIYESKHLKEELTVVTGALEVESEDDTVIIKSDDNSEVQSKMELKSTKALNGDDRWVQDLESKVDQLTKEIELKNDSIERMSKKVDEANELAAAEKKELATLQLKYKEELVKVENLEKEIEKINEDALVANSQSHLDKLKEAQNEVKKYKHRLKFAQSQIQTLEKAKKAALNKGTNDKKLSHLEKLLDKQKILASKKDTEIADYKKDNHRLNQDNKILLNKIKDLERKLNIKNKTAA